jgi:sarcosine oxidase subunit delta
VILIPCPYCGPRNVSEYGYAGEQRRRPDPAASDPAQWRSYLYLRANAAGRVTETWLHRAGCGRYLTVERDTVTNEVWARDGQPQQVSEADVPPKGTGDLAADGWGTP